jgi:putative ABC transport system ATP-binding protein
MDATSTTDPQAVAGQKRPTLIEVRQVNKSYTRGRETLRVLDGLELTIGEGEFVALMGPSGAGKTTLLNIMAGLDQPDSGSVRVGGVELVGLSDNQLASFRASNVGFIFQTYNLLPVLTARENVELPLLLTHLGSAERRRRAETALKVVGLADRMDHHPNQLSGGQEQRVAIARAIVTDPKLLVADEPTGDLDRTSADEILKLLVKLQQEFNKTILMVTHDPEAAASAGRVIHLEKAKSQ